MLVVINDEELKGLRVGLAHSYAYATWYNAEAMQSPAKLRPEISSTQEFKWTQSLIGNPCTAAKRTRN